MTTPLPAPQTSGGYITLPVTTSADALQAAALDHLATSMPGWTPREGHLEVWLIEAMAQMLSETAVVASKVPLAIFQFFGQQLLGLAPIPGAAATMPSTWTVSDATGRTIPAGTVVGYSTAGTSFTMFATQTAVTVPAGQTQTSPGQVTLVAQQIGPDANGLPAGPLVLVDNLAYVTGVVSTAASSGGVAAEDQTAYLSRLSGELALLSPRPIIPSDFSALARNQPGVARATTLDGYNPATGTSNNARTVTVACVDASGNALPTGTQNAVAAALQAQREANFIVNVVAPTYTSVDVAAQVVAVRGANVSTVTAAVSAAVAAFLSPASWGGPAPAWTNTSAVRYLTVAGLIAEVPGVSYVTAIQMAVTGSALRPQDVQLSGAVPMPRAGAVNVNVTAGS